MKKKSAVEGVPPSNDNRGTHDWLECHLCGGHGIDQFEPGAKTCDKCEGTGILAYPMNFSDRN